MGKVHESCSHISGANFENKTKMKALLAYALVHALIQRFFIIIIILN